MILTEEEKIEINKSDVAIDAFCAALKAKMNKSTIEKGRRGWDDPNSVSNETLTEMMKEHIDKGDMRDVALFSMMIWFRENHQN